MEKLTFKHKISRAKPTNDTKTKAINDKLKKKESKEIE